MPAPEPYARDLVPDSGPLPEGSNSRWYVVHTRTRAEQRAAVNLNRQGYRTFCPFVPKTVRHARKLMRVFGPMFPNYLFVRLDVTSDRWHSVNGTRGVIRLITQGDTPVPVPRGIVEALQIPGGDDSVTEGTVRLMCGQIVRVCAGPFADFIGRIENFDGEARVRVLLDLMGRSVPVTVTADMLGSAD